MASPLIKSHLPICSLVRLRELGWDAASVASCAPPPSVSGDNTVLGCPVWKDCRFNKPGYGSFKGQQPQLVGYYYRTIEGRAKTDFIACHGFVATLQSAMDQGIADRMRGAANYEVVKIIAQEGEPLTRAVTKLVTLKDGVTTKFNKVKETLAVPAMTDPAEMDQFLEFERDIIAEFEGRMASEVGVEHEPAVPVKGKA
jgi:hypothetical protein